jgi:hypothetical protein
MATSTMQRSLSFVISIAPPSRRASRTHVTVTRDSGHSNVAQLFDEQERRIPTEDQLTVTFGFLGSYPNALFAVQEDQLEAFVDAVERLETDSD